MLGNILSAGMSILGGLLGRKDQEKQQEQNWQHQKEMAQSGIQWKVADAQKAGIHPIYALGAPTASWSGSVMSDPLAPALASAGQDIGRAINSTSSVTQRATAYSQAAQTLQLERGGLENELLRTQLARSRQNLNPAIPDATQKWGIEGQGETAIPSGPIKEKAERQNWDPGSPSNEAFAHADVSYARTPAGGYFPVPSKDVKERIEDIEPAEWAWFARNNLPQAFGAKHNPPFAAPPGQRWEFSPIDGYMLRPDIPSSGWDSSDRPDNRRMWGTSKWLDRR